MKPAMKPALFLFNPNFVTLRVSGSVFDGLVPGNAHRPGDGFNDPLQLPANISTVSGIHFRGLDLIDELALLAGNHNHAGKMRIALDRFVLKVDEVRRNKNKQENQRDHDVIVQAAPLIRPKNVSADCAPDRAHGRDGAFKRRRGCFRLLQVYLGIHGMANPASRAGVGRDRRRFMRSLSSTESLPQSLRELRPGCGRCPYKAAAPPECARCRRLADSFPGWQTMYDLQLMRCHSMCAGIQSCSSPRDGSGYLRAVPGKSRSSSTKKSRGIDFVPAARLQCHKSWPKRIPYRRYTTSPRGSASRVSAARSRHRGSVSPVRHTNS